jgi:3-deoxy-7-phosphoheptulonate synthase
MIITLEPDAPETQIDAVVRLAARYPGVSTRTFTFQGEATLISEVHLIGSTAAVPTESFEGLPGVRRVVRVSKKYRLIGRHGPGTETHEFEYNGVRFDGRRLHVFAGLCAVDTRDHVAQTMAALEKAGIHTTRMGVYKPRTSPYDFQGLGKTCLPWVFELAGKHGIRVIAMEVTDARHIDEIREALEKSGEPTGVMLQIGTRNTQNFELLKHVGQQRRFPVLFKRGMGISLEESLNACEYVASEGNPNIVFCLRGVKTHLGDPHRNLVDYAHVPVVRRQTRLPVCIDPSHAVGRMERAPDGLPDIFHVVGQGLIAGASMVLIDIHPRPELALCDGPQALHVDELPRFMRYAQVVRDAYEDIVREFSQAVA